jgi:nitrate reductase gamma subunit
MEKFANGAFLVGLAWATVVLAAQAARARGRRADFSEKAGSPLRGVLYNFTAGMLPWRKETAGRHPFKFVIGVTMHIGVFAAGVSLLLSFNSVATAVARALPFGIGELRHVLLAFVVLGFVAAVYLFFRRMFSRNLRAMSSAEDFIAILATCGFLGLTAAWLLHPPMLPVARIFAAAVFIYMPFGKLRHVVFFFAARGSYGAKLGARGVYPVTGERKNERTEELSRRR